jgi:alpha-tubulin suppressor-like RCC1 family protein
MNSSLVYPESNTNTYKNVLLIDSSSIPDYQTFFDSANGETFPIIYSFASTKTDLLTVLKKQFTFNTIERVAIVFISGLTPSLFLDEQPFFNYLNATAYNENTQFLLSILKEFQVKNIDFLACNTLNFPSWTNYYQTLTQETGVVVGASNDRTGNLKYGGDWIMESTMQDIELIYFTKSIEYYRYLLDISDHSAFIDNSGYIITLGDNTYGQLGWTYRPFIYSVPIVETLLNYNSLYLRKNEKGLSVSCGSYHTVVLSNYNNLYAFGLNSTGQLGMNNTTNLSILTPMVLDKISLDEKIISIACGIEHTVVLTNTGNVFACGNNTYGQLGMNNTTNLSILTPMVLNNLTANNDKVISIACGISHTVVLTVSGNLYACGRNTTGQLGLNNNSTLQRTTLVKMSGPSDGYVGTEMPRYVACGGYHTVVLTNNNNLYACGYNFEGQLGYGYTNSSNNILNKMLSPSLSSGEKFISLSCGAVHTVVLTNKNNIYGCGNNAYGKLGQISPGIISTLSKFSSQYGNALQGSSDINLSTDENFISVTCGNNHTLVLTDKDRIYGCGDNSKGQLSSKVVNNVVVPNNINTSNTYTTLTTNLFVIYDNYVENNYKSMMGLPFFNGVNIQVTSGWNMISSSENARIFDPNGIIIKNTVLTFSSNIYKPAKNNTDISGNYGYWLKCNQPGTITLTYL